MFKLVVTALLNLLVPHEKQDKDYGKISSIFNKGQIDVTFDESF
jgi:hypothetical protein